MYECFIPFRGYRQHVILFAEIDRQFFQIGIQNDRRDVFNLEGTFDKTELRAETILVHDILRFHEDGKDGDDTKNAYGDKKGGLECVGETAYSLLLDAECADDDPDSAKNNNGDC